MTAVSSLVDMAASLAPQDVTTRLFLTQSVTIGRGTKRVRRILSSPMNKRVKRPCPSSTVPMNPHEFIISFMQARGGDSTVQSSLNVKDFFFEHSDEQVESYGTLAPAVRSKDMSALRKLHKAGMSMQSSNRFGESLIHMSCRLGCLDIASFFIKEAGVSVRVRDDFGRTPLHDACWTSEPNMELIDLILNECPELLLMADKRGHTPFQYTRKEHGALWLAFLRSREDLLCRITG